MKVTHWWKKLSAAIVAAGIWVPNAYAVSIPLGDPGFETYVVPSRGYAYAADPFGAYRVSPPPLSAWVDDLDAPAGYVQDNGVSNWLYNATYAEATQFSKRPAPRNGSNQAMHGLFNYSAQETSAVFAAGQTYTFSLWAQNDELLNDTNGVFLYIFDGTLPFSDANALAGALYTAIPQRTAGMTAAQSQANWGLLSIAHTVAAGAPEIGHPVGVGFFARRDSAVDDASLDVVPEPATIMLVGMSGLTVLGLRRRR
jgi:hypothetical protein